MKFCFLAVRPRMAGSRRSPAPGHLPAICLVLAAALGSVGPPGLPPAWAADPAPPTTARGKCTVPQESFGKTPAGSEETLFVCRNAQGCEVRLTSYGARIVAVTVPDREGKLANVTLGFDTLAGYVAHKSFFGCTTGRFANRIAQGRFKLDGKSYQLALNNGPNSLHGGLVGFDRKHWEAKPFETRRC